MVVAVVSVCERIRVCNCACVCVCVCAYICARVCAGGVCVSPHLSARGTGASPPLQTWVQRLLTVNKRVNTRKYSGFLPSCTFRFKSVAEFHTQSHCFMNCTCEPVSARKGARAVTPAPRPSPCLTSARSSPQPAVQFMYTVKTTYFCQLITF